MPEEVDPRIYEMQEKVHCDRTKIALKHILEEGKIYDTDYLEEWIAHPIDGPFWKSDSPYNFFEKIRTPVYCFGGWFDYFVNGTVRSFVEIDAPKKLLIGPWFHGGNEGLDLLNVQLRWFDYWLKGVDNGVMDEPPVRLFVMGKDEWRFEDSWPPKVRRARFYLRGGDKEPSYSLNDGLLNTTPPDSAEPADRITHDPENPVPSVAFRNAEISRAEKSMLTYTTEPLEEDIEIAGPIELHLCTSTSGRDVDWFVRMTDVLPEGSSIVLASGVLKGSHYRSHELPEDLVPGKIYEFRIDISPTCKIFPKGHRIRLDIANSNFPEFYPNPVASESMVYHDPEHRSYVVFPVRK